LFKTFIHPETSVIDIKDLFLQKCSGQDSNISTFTTQTHTMTFDKVQELYKVYTKSSVKRPHKTA